MLIPEDLKYTIEHEWVREEGENIVVGITDYAQEALGELVYIELPSEGDEINKGDTFGAVESTKSVSDLFAPLSGEVVEVNEALLDSPELINQDPYGEGWLIKVKPFEADELSGCIDFEEYTVRNNDQKPSRNRSSGKRLGDRCRDRLLTRSCCFIIRLSATTAFAPPGPSNLATVVNRCMSNTSRSFITGSLDAIAFKNKTV